MGIFLNSKKGNNLVAVFDIGSSSVGGALFFTQKSGGPKMVFSVREPIALMEKVSPEKLLSLTMKSLELVASRICLAGFGAPKKFFCVLSAPWGVSQTRIITLEKSTSFSFTSKLADDLIKKEIALLKKEHSSKNKKSGEEVRYFEIKSINTLLNGYPTSNPIGKKATELEMAILISMSPEQVLEKIEDIIARHFHSQEVEYSAFSTVAFVIARGLLAHHENFLLVDIGGEMTEISLVKENVLSESASFPMGRNFITRGVASSLKSSLSEAKSIISLYKDAHAHHATEKKLEPIIKKLKIEWLKKFQECLSNFQKDFSLPSVIFITVDADMASFFGDIIEGEDFHQYAFTESKFRVTFLDSKELHGVATFKEGVARDASLTISSVYINRFLC